MDCPHCSSINKVVKNGFTSYKIQKYFCKNCRKQFVDRRFLVYKKFSDQRQRDAEIIRHLERKR